MNRPTQTFSELGNDAVSKIEHVIALIDELILVVGEENAWLAQGLPASRSKQIARKTELADSFEKCVENIASRISVIHTNDEALRARFIERMEILKTAMDENIVRLRAAIQASQRRIEAVMNAIKEQVVNAPPYKANGRLHYPAASIGTNIRA
jgi:chaperonin cofactor prefoldin